jgi:hypothetical protein
MEVMHARCAGLDVHKQTVVACVRVATASTARHEVRTFATTPAGGGDPAGVFVPHPIQNRTDDVMRAMADAAVPALLAAARRGVVAAGPAHAGAMVDQGRGRFACGARH